RLAVEAADRYPAGPIAPAIDADHVLRLAPHTVLGPEQAHRTHASRHETINHVDEPCVDAGGMAEHAVTPAAAQVEPLGAKNIKTRSDCHGCPSSPALQPPLSPVGCGDRQLRDLDGLEPDLAALVHELVAHALALPLLAKSRLRQAELGHESLH